MSGYDNPFTGGVSGSKDERADVTVTALPEDGFEVKWTATGIVLPDPPENPLRFKMPANNVEIVAEFVEKKQPESYKVDIDYTGLGMVWMSVDGKPTTEALEGSEVIITALADEAYQFVRWTATGITLSNPTANPLKFKMPSANVSVKAEFALR